MLGKSECYILYTENLFEKHRLNLIWLTLFRDLFRHIYMSPISVYVANSLYETTIQNVQNCLHVHDKR